MRLELRQDSALKRALVLGVYVPIGVLKRDSDSIPNSETIAAEALSSFTATTRYGSFAIRMGRARQTFSSFYNRGIHLP